ncbi:MAG: enoyl-CoA hydratase/isomerase family protein [Planctomycetes bacterium]|nr:enoyl-CoA hydratase/isomerase family protein [Planctomycetota bacterium]
MSTDYQSIALNTHGPVASLQLNRPRKANALNAEMAQELIDAFRWLDQELSVRVVVLTGAGRFFSAGIDLEYLQQIQADVMATESDQQQLKLLGIIEHLQQVTMAVELCRKPVVAQISGVCYGFGLDLAAACDMRYCTDKSRFSVKEVDLAIIADLGSLQRLPGIIGEGKARELAFTGRDFFGPEAAAMGFANQCFTNANQSLASADALEQHVVELANQLALKSPRTLRGVKQSMNFSRDHSLADGLKHIAAKNSVELLRGDLAEVVTARMQKRQPQFPD